MPETTHRTIPSVGAHIAALHDDEEQLRLHLRDAHPAADTREQDSVPTLMAEHALEHADDQPAAPPPPEVPAAILEARGEVELYRLKAAEASYDVDMPSTLRERMSYARSLAASSLIPKAFRSSRGGDDGLRETSANVLLAIELGNTLGLSPLQALCQVNVVEGRPGLGAEAQLAQVLKAGHDLYVEEDSDNTKATVVAQRMGSERVQRFSYTLDDAVRSGLCRIVDGQPHARSQGGKPLPWETSTADMLVWRAVTRACKRVFPDVTGGLAVVDDDPGSQYGTQQASATVTAAQETPARATRATAAGDSLEDDLALFTEQTGPWSDHAGATVRRRSKLQLAADRLMDAHNAGLIPQPDQVDNAGPAEAIVDAELIDEPTVAPTTTAGPLADDDLGGPAVVVDVSAELDAMRDQLAGEPIVPAVAEPQPEPIVPAEPAHSDPAADLQAMVAAGVAQVAQEAAQEAAPDEPATTPAQLDRDQLWDAVEALAAERGKTPAQLLARHVLATRTNPEAMTAEQLEAFLAAQRGL